MKCSLPLLLAIVAIASWVAVPIPLDPMSVFMAAGLLGAVCFGLGYWCGRLRQ